MYQRLYLVQGWYMKKSPCSRGRTVWWFRNYHGKRFRAALCWSVKQRHHGNTHATNGHIGMGCGHFPWFVHIRTRAEDRFITTHSNINQAAAKERRGNYDSLLLFSHLRKFNFKHWCPLLIHHYSSLPNPQCKAPSRSFISLHFTLIKTQCDSIGRVYLQKLFKSALKMNEPPPVLLSER